jgi:hypothetical protein
VCQGAGEGWFSEQADSSPPTVFRQSDCEHSTYGVESDIDEAVTVAAHLLTDPAMKVDTRHALRIRYADLRETGIQIDRRHLGQTGVVAVDHSHCDLLGDNQTMRRLTALIVRRVREGQDRIRRLNRYLLQLMIDRIFRLGEAERPSHTAELCEKVLNRRSQLTRNREQASRELASARIPDRAIRPLAFKFYEERVPSAGSPTDDWFRAVGQLRNQYAIHYLRSHFLDG